MWSYWVRSILYRWGKPVVIYGQFVNKSLIVSPFVHILLDQILKPILQVLHKDSENRQPKFLFDSLPQFPPMQAEASQTVYSYTTKRLPELQYRRPRPLLPNAKLTPFYGSSEELLLSYTSSTGRPNRFPSNEIVTFRELHEPIPGNKRIPSELKSVITISGAIIAFAVLGFFVLLISCKVSHNLRNE